MEAILFKNGVYVGVDTDIDKSLDSNKIQEDKDLVVAAHGNKLATLFGGRVEISMYTHRSLTVDGIKIKSLCSTSLNDGVSSISYAKVSSGLSCAKVTSYLNQMQQLGVDSFLANYKQSIEKAKEELTVMCDKLEGELSIREDEEKTKLLGKLREVIIEMVVILFGLMVDVNVGLDNHDYVDAYNEIVNEYCVD